MTADEYYAHQEEASKKSAEKKAEKEKRTIGSNIYIKGYDYSKFPKTNAATDYRNNSAALASLLNFVPYETGYCFLAVMSVPRFMVYPKDGIETAREIYNKLLLDNFVDIIEKEFLGLSGINDSTLSTTDISDNRTNTPVIVKNDRDPYTTIDMTFTEQSGTPLTKFLEQYTTLIYDPYAHVKTYGGRLRMSDKTKFWDTKASSANFTLENDLHNEVFNLLYVITDPTCLLVEKAFILHNAQPLNVSYSTLYNMNKFEFSTKAITINWNCLVLDGKYCNRLGQVYIRNLMESVNTSTDPVGNVLSISGGKTSTKGKIITKSENIDSNILKLDASNGRWSLK